MNWQGILRNQWFQLCLVAAICSGGAGIFDLATISTKNPPTPVPSPSPFSGPHPSLAFVPLHAKKTGHWIVDASGAGDSDSRNLAQVVGSAAAGDTVTIRPGRYEAGLAIDKDLALIGEGTYPANPLIFFNRDQYNVVFVQAGHVTFSNLQIEQDFNTSFAAFYCGKQAHVEFTSCSVRSKSAYCVSVVDEAQLEARDSLFTSSEIGYGILFSGRTHGTVTRSNIVGNKFGLEVQNQSRVSVDSCTFQSNGDQNGYGVVLNVDGNGATLEVARSHFLQNAAGVYAQESGNLTMTGCTLENNGISLEAAHVTGGLICVETAAQATLTDLTCKFNKQGVSVLTAGKAQLNNVNLSATGIVTNNTQYIVYCNAVYINGDGSTISISKSAISDSVYNAVAVVNQAKAVVDNSSISNSKANGLAFGSDDGTPGYGTINDSTVSGNRVAGIFVQAKGSVEINGGEISSNVIDGVDVDGEGSIAKITNIFVRNHPKVGIMAYSGGSVTAKRCTIEKNQFGLQAGIPNKGPEFGGAIALETSIVQDNIGYGAISCAGSVISLTGNRFQNGRHDYFRESGGIIRNVGN
jgi:hypothetical protein